MRTAAWTVTLVAILALVAPKALAQDVNAPKGHGTPIESMLEKVGASDEQKAKAKEILDAARAKAAKADSPDAKHEILMGAMEEIKKTVLTDEQRKKLTERPGGPMGSGGTMAGGPSAHIMAILDKLGATDEQKTKAKAILDAAHAKAEQEQTPDGKMKVMVAAMEDIKKNVLTDEQRKKMAELPPAGPPAGGMKDMALLDKVGLTDDQKAKVKAIFEAARLKAEKADTREARRDIMQAAMNDVVKNVLTDDQRAKFETEKAAAQKAAATNK